METKLSLEQVRKMSQEDYWINHAKTGKWRTARKEHDCDYRKDGFKCAEIIKPGEKYLDSGEWKRTYVTYKYCKVCARKDCG
jgi:hypothetical protein